MARKSKVLYFTRHDEDLWAAIQKISQGDQNHEIRKALRAYFLGEGQSKQVAAPPKEEPIIDKLDVDFKLFG
jgi:hypothetical protein